MLSALLLLESQLIVATVRFNSLDPVLSAMHGLVLTMLLLIWGRASGSLKTEGFLVPVLCKSFEFLASDLLLIDCTFKGQNTGLSLVADELVVVGIFASFIFTAIRFEWFLCPRDVCCVRWLVTRVLMDIFWISSFLLNFFPPLDLLYFLLS